MGDPPDRRPTLRHVARRAGVSVKTVSRVINGEPGVSEEMAARVETAIVGLGYRPDQRARSLRQGSTRTGVIGFLLVDVANPFFSAVLRGIEDVARDRDSLVLAGSTDGAHRREDQLVEAFVARRVDGLIVVPATREVGAPLRHELDRGTPVVFLDLEPADHDVDVVRSDHYGGAMAATRHLIAHGHRDIACFADDQRIHSAELRIAGFCDAMHDADITVPPDRLVAGTRDVDGWREVAGEHLRRPDRPTALFTAQNLISTGTIHALHELGLQRSVAQVGFDDVELADVVEPGISVVPQRPQLLGRRAADLLFARLDGSTAAPVRELVANDLIERGSGEISPPR